MRYLINGTALENLNNRIMCLYTKYITNKKYQPNRKNNFNAPACQDRRLLLVPAKCGKCIECRKERKREWVIRLNEESKLIEFNNYLNELRKSIEPLGIVTGKQPDRSGNLSKTRLSATLSMS